MMDEPPRSAGHEVEFSVVVPVYDTVAEVEQLVERLVRVFDAPLGATREIILVDDGSPNPETWPNLETLAERFPEVHAIRLSRNFGKASAVLCGFEAARGEWVVTMDDDLQHLPEDLPKLAEMRDHDVVMGAYRTKNHSLSKRVTSRIKNWFDRILAGKPRHLVSNPYRMHKASVVRAICQMKSPYPFISAMMYYVTTDIATVEIEHGVREGRKSSFGFARRVQSFSNLLINRSAFLMRLVAFAGLFVSALSGLGGGAYLLSGALSSESITFERTLLITLLFVSGLVLFAIAVIGEYLTRILVGVERRPPYLVRQVALAQPNTAEEVGRS